MPNSIRGKLIIGLLPGFVVLVFLAAVSLYAINLLADANLQVADANREMEFTHSLQLKLQQVLIPLDDDVTHGSHSDNQQQFEILAASIDQLFVDSLASYGEDEELALHRSAVTHWQTARGLAETLLAESAADGEPEPTAAMMAEFRLSVGSIWQNLEYLQKLVAAENSLMIVAGERARRFATRLLGLTTAAFLLAGVLFVSFFARYLTRPIQALQTGAVQIGSGDLNYRLDVTSRDELGKLATEFNRMAARLEDSHTRLEERVVERTAQLHTIAEASRIIASDLELERVLQRIADLARSLSTTNYASVLVPRQNHTVGAPRFIHSREMDSQEIHPPHLPDVDQLMSVLLVADGPVHFDSRVGDPNSEGLRTDCPPVQKFLVVPVRAHGKTIGGLCVGGRADALPFSTEDEEVMTMLAATAAVAIENARLYGELTRINEELEARVLDRTRQLEAVSEERTRYAEELRQVLDRNVRVQEAERRRIAQEIHDGVSQWLMGALFEIQAARVRLSLDMSEAHLHLQEAQRVLKFVKEEMRRVVYDLHPPLLESNGLVAAIRGYIADLETHTSQQYEFRVEGATQRLHPRQELALFRIAQEALNNVVQHADTSLAEVTLLFSPEGVCLRVTDSGPGFDPQQANDSGRPSLGLMSMHERASTVGGTLHIQSEPGEGAQVEVCVPAERIWQRNDEPVISVEAERI